MNLIFKCIKLVIMTFNMCYFTGMFWFIACDLNHEIYFKGTRESIRLVDARA